MPTSTPVASTPTAAPPTSTPIPPTKTPVALPTTSRPTASTAGGHIDDAFTAQVFAGVNQRRVSAGLLPLAVESYGRLGIQASRFLSTLGDLAASGGGVSKARFVRRVRQELSCALCRGNSQSYTVLSVARSAGKHFEAAADTPAAEF